MPSLQRPCKTAQVMTSFENPAEGIAKNIGLQQIAYPVERNISSLNLHRAIYKIVPSDFTAIPQTLRDQMNKSVLFKTCVTCPVEDPTIDCYHYFNSLPLNGVPFVCTFESSVPRWWGVDEATWRLGLDILTSESCRQLFALSRNTIDVMRTSLARYGNSVTELIMNKVTLVYPPQPLCQTPNREKFSGDEIRIAFVGADFLRKGGYEFLCAAAKLLSDGANIRVHIVSTMIPRSEDFPWNKAPNFRISEAQRIINCFSNRISYSPRLSNSEVMKLFCYCHVAALPSFHDTFGYSVIEAQSNLCAALTTNQRAFPEINPEQAGWTVVLPIDHLAQISYRREDFAELSQMLHDGILQALTQIVDCGMDAIRAKAETSFHRVAVFHDPRQIEDTIFRYY
jgi:glycosyltransferase involved in cell wall biosynthesis